MAGKKKEASLQVAITNQGQWDELLATKGLIVVDVYQRWCGPCCAVFSLFRKIKNELGDNLLHFATAEADSVDSLQRYRGKCEPTFVFYGGGSLVAELHGANAPLLQKMVLEQLEQEKRVMEQGAERRVMQEELMEKDLGITHNEQIPVHKSYTIAVIKPDVVTHGKTNEIIMKIQEAGFEITGQEVRMLTRAEAEDFYQHMAAESYFRELVQIMCNGPSHILLISHREQSVDVIQTWRKFTDTATMEGAKGEVTDSLKGQCGASLLSNALHGCSDRSQANRALALFFPGLRHAFAYSQDGAEESTVERTLALIPPAISREDIILRIPAIGLNIVMKRELLLTEEQIRQFYWQHLQEDQFPTLLKSMSRGPILALVLSGHDAVKKWRSMLDVDWAQQSSDSLAADLVAHGESINLLYGSHTADQAEQEIQVVFPPEKTLALIKPDTAEEHKDEILKAIQDAGFSILHMMEVCLSQVDIEKLYRKLQDKPFFNQLVDFMCSGPCMALILSKYRAVQEWRAMMGPNDPCQTHEITTESLRVRFGKDILHNAVHGSSSPERAKEEIHLVFGDVCREENQASLLHGKERALDSQLPLEGSKANGLELANRDVEPIDLPVLPVKDELQHPSTPTMMLEGEAGEGVL